MNHLEPIVAAAMAFWPHYRRIAMQAPSDALVEAERDLVDPYIGRLMHDTAEAFLGAWSAKHPAVAGLLQQFDTMGKLLKEREWDVEVHASGVEETCRSCNAVNHPKTSDNLREGVHRTSCEFAMTLRAWGIEVRIEVDPPLQPEPKEV